MDKLYSTRREFIKTVGIGAATMAIPSAYAEGDNSLLVVNPEPRFELSPYLYMQFMEPLGTTDGSVAAAWDFLFGSAHRFAGSGLHDEERGRRLKGRANESIFGSDRFGHSFCVRRIWRSMVNVS